jgi:tetratricopeptide (TPR) repeat protein/DNA-binding winged helix-turn-helix (wHTH) protein
MDDPPVYLLRCGDFEINALSNSLTFAGQTIRVNAQHVKVLWLLLMNSGKILSIRQILSGVWWAQGTYVKESSVHTATYRLSKVLETNDPQRAALWIETHRNSGYVLHCNQPIVAVHDASFRAGGDALAVSAMKALGSSGADALGVIQRSEFAHVLASPHHMPRAPLDFTGRREQLQNLITGHAAGVRLIGLHGGFGVGKTSLALKCAEELGPKYPEAHCYLDLKGLSSSPLCAADAMRHVIWSLRPDTRLPQTDEELGMLYRSILYDKRALLLFDNVRDAAQIKLLSPPPSCLLIVTSRFHFVFPGMLEEEIMPLAPEDAENLLLTITPRIKPQVETIALLCGYIPIALRAAGSAIAEHIDLDPADYAANLTSARARLALWDPTEDLSIEASIRLSYDLLTDDLRRQFRILSVFPGPFDVYAAAAVSESGIREAQEALSSLVRFALAVFNPVDRRYSLLDFPRIYSDSVVSSPERYRAALNHASHFERVLAIAESLYLKGRELTKVGLELFHTEMSNIHAGQAWCANRTIDDPTAAALCNKYPEVGFYVLEFSHHPNERIAWSTAALHAARRMNDARMEGRHLGSLGIAYWRLGDARRAAVTFKEALSVTKRSKDAEGRSRAFRGLGLACQALGWRHRALHNHQCALEIDRALRDKRNVGRDLNNLGIAYAAIGETDSAIKCHRRHLTIARTAGDIRAESAAIGNLAVIYRQLTKTRRAISLYKRALAIDCEIGDMVGESGDLFELGLAYADLGNRNDAIECFERALRLTRRTGEQLREADTLFAISQTQYKQGDIQTAIVRAQESLDLYEELKQHRAKRIRAIINRWQNGDV